MSAPKANATSRTRLAATRIRARKQEPDRARLVMITAYDAPHARLAEAAGVDIILVGDSVGTTLLGYDSTTEVTIEEIIHHCRAARRGAPNTHISADLPFGTYEVSDEQAVASAVRLIREGRADSVKLEGGVRMASRIRAITSAGIPVIGHVGLLPQTAAGSGGMKLRGRSLEEARAIIADARAVAEAGATACVMEMIPAGLARRITEMLAIPTIGIGAGADCDGQVLVINDVLGMDLGFSPTFLKRYAELETTIHEAIARYAKDVRSGAYPAAEHAFSLPDDVGRALDDHGEDTP
jgi:3-methyl-2-oxobutanoate hydroxymethyltransferase